jgi:Zn-dependent M28 family amino/carboxypeptidase
MSFKSFATARPAVVTACLWFSVACSSQPAAPPQPAGPTTLAEFPQVDADAVLGHIKVLASDEYEGRRPGTKGEELTVSYLTDQFKGMGLAPGNPDGTYAQQVPLVGITAAPAPLTFRKGQSRLTLKFKDDYVAATRRVTDTVGLNNSEVVFVGYGVVAPEYNWDDYKGMDLKGKTLLMLVNDPPVPDPNDPSKLDPNTFGGRAMTYYGRWTYKYDIAGDKGAAGAIIIHESGPAGYDFNVVQSSWTGEQQGLVTPDKNMTRPSVEAWIALDKAKDLLRMAGQDFDTLKARAKTREFKPVPLGVTASVTLHNTLREMQSRNVIAKLEGSDPALKDEYVVYTAHWDHLGVGEPVNGDTIYNGAIDNASGTAGLLEIARAFTKLPQPPKRSVLFMAVTAEEQGLLGSEYYSVQPLYPLKKTLAEINMDELNVHGKTLDVPIIGLGNSQLDDYVKAAAAEQGRTVVGDAQPEKGYYYRSDHFSFAKQGVPALNPDFARELQFVGKPADYGQQIVDNFEAHDYHAPSDEVRPDWDMSGAQQDLELFFAVGYRVAQAEKYPEWSPTSEFKAKREEMLR